MENNKPIKKRDMGIAGALIVIAQSITSFHSTQNISDQVEKLNQKVQESNIEREQFFVRKVEITSISQKMDRLSNQLVKLKEQVLSLEVGLKKSYVFQGLEECDPVIYSCPTERELIVYDR